MICFGHRGAKGYVLENTIASFQKALDLGASWIELDVHEISDELYISHDVVKKEDLYRTLRLSQVFDEFRNRLNINVELKGRRGVLRLATFIKEQLAIGWSADAILLSSFNLRALEELHTMCPEVWIGLLYYGLPAGFKRDIETCGARSVHLALEYTSREVVEEIHFYGCKVFVYTVNDECDIEQMKRLNVDGIFSDYPDRVITPKRN